MLRISPWVLVVLAGCTDRLALETASGSSGSTGADEASTSSGQGPTSEPTTDSPTGAPTTADATTSAPTTGGASEPGETSDTSETGGTSSTGEPGTPSTCGPPCADTWTKPGDLNVGWGETADDLACLVEVTGTLSISGPKDVAELAGLRNLRRVGRLQIDVNSTLTDLSPFACLEQADDGLGFFDVPALTDASTLAGLRSAGHVSFEATGITAMPSFAPEFTGVHTLHLRDNPALTDLGAVAGWGHLAGGSLTIQLDNNQALTSLVGLEGLIAAAGDAAIAVQVTHSPKLKSLAGLEAMTSGALWLQELPLVTDLLPLSGLTKGNNITLFGLPGVKNLQGLHNLETVDWLMIGDCVSAEPGAPGLDGLVDLTGLGALTTASSLSIANNENLAALTGAPKLTFVGGMEVIENPKLTQADVDALVAQLDAAPDQCVGDFDQCTCFEILPW